MVASALVCRFFVLATTVGKLRVTAGPSGVLSLEFRPDDLAKLRARLSERLEIDVRLEQSRDLPVLDELDEYFRGTRREFSVELDLSLVRGFELTVLRKLVKVPFGTTISYGELAARSGNARAARAVGGAMRKNPIPILVPCHRVTAVGGAIGGFSGGLDVKRALLALEGVSGLSF
jgi:methylated-DNA-[protein]-cysteine S-methyltransferase